MTASATRTADRKGVPKSAGLGRSPTVLILRTYYLKLRTVPRVRRSLGTRRSRRMLACTGNEHRMTEPRKYRAPTELEREFLRVCTRGYPELEAQIESCEVADYDATGWCDVRVLKGPPLLG